MEDWKLVSSVRARFRMDGIERIPGVPASPGVVPFRMTGDQFTKHRILFQQLIPGHAYTFPNESLSSQEQVRKLTQVMNWLLQPFCVLIQLILADDGDSRSLWNVGTPIYQTTKSYTSKTSAVSFCLSYLPIYQELYPKRHIQFPFVLAIYQTTKSYTSKDIFSFLLS